MNVDLFAGPGGWDGGARPLGIDLYGIEWDQAACDTRRAAGLPTLQADVAALDPQDFAPVVGFVASAPCQAFSMAGKGAGRAAIGAYRRAIARMATGELVDVAELDAACHDPRAHLTLEPLRWILELRPRWIALEQVKEVLPLWDAYGTVLRRLGYSVWLDVLNAEEYGVPQTRKRAILIASRDRTVGRPAPSHAAYVPPNRRVDHGEGLFDADQGAHLPPPVSMAQALGWGMTDRPIASSRSTGGPDKEKVGGSAARAVLYGERDAGRWAMGDVVQENGTVRPMDEPAPTITSSMDNGNFRFVVDTGMTRGKGEISPTSDRIRSTDEPAPPLTTRADQMEWVHERPATTVAGDPRIWAPGHKLNADDIAAGDDAIRVSIEEAALLQTFPADYPWQGTKTKQFQQVGNAVPPLLAYAVLAEATGKGR